MVLTKTNFLCKWQCVLIKLLFGIYPVSILLFINEFDSAKLSNKLLIYVTKAFSFNFVTNELFMFVANECSIFKL